MTFASPCDEASAIAVEHVLWAKQQGLKPGDIFDALGLTWETRRAPDWHDAVLALSCSWRRRRATRLAA